ncbi:MAG: exo-alpha-sialidase [Opitutae bacterium]|nr:exo-alpha-sialidase [Opitutae bacterium]
MAVALLATNESRAEGVTGVTELYSVPSSWYQLRTVEIVCYDATHVAIAWRNEPDSVEHDRGDIMFKSGSSADGGATWTWSATQYMKQSDSTASYVNVVMYNESGTLYAFIGKSNPISNPDPGTSVNVCMKSTNMGVSWTPQAITNSYTGHMALGGHIVKSGTTYFMPFHASGTQGFLKSTNLINWSLAGIVPNPEDVSLQEGFLVVSQDNPNHLICKMRVKVTDGGGLGYAYSSISTDGGTTWSNAIKDLELPNWGVKGCLYKDSNNQYVYLYNTEDDRETLYYKTRAPGKPWKAGRPFTSNTLAGKDCYAMLSEYAPGKYYALWENSYHNVYFGKLDVSDAITTQDVMDTDWNNLTGWTVSPGSGLAEISPAGQLHLKSTTASVASVLKNVGPTTSFTLDMRAQVSDHTSTAGISLGTKIIAGTRRLMLDFKTDGVYSMVGSATTWSRVFTQAGDTAWHNWRVTVDAAGVARLYQDGGQSLASWSIQSPYVNTNPLFQHWVEGVSGNGCEARIDWSTVSEGVVANDFVDLVGLTVAAGGGTVEISPASQLHMRSANNTNAEITVPNGPGTTAPFSLEFRAQVNAYTANAPATGVSLGLKVHNGAKRLMLAIQGDGVYSVLSGGSAWVKVYNTTNDTNWHVWRVEVDASGTARLYRDGGPQLASWSIQADTGYARFGSWVKGSSTSPAEARLDWVKVN